MLSQELQDELAKKFGPGRIARASDALALRYERLPTGSMQLDSALGGGVPKGRIVEFAGLESHGKTTALLKIIAENQRRGETCAFIDAEHSFDSTYAAQLGVNLRTLDLSEPDSAEEMIDLAEMLILSREVGIVAIDSITGPVPLHVQERSADEPTMGVEAKLNNLFCRKVITAMSPGDLTKKTNRPWCALIYVNQLRAKFGGPMAGEDVGGGYGLRFFKSIGVLFKRSRWIDGDGKDVIATKDEKWGQTISFVAKKNKTFVPHGTGEVDFYFKDTSIGVYNGQYDLLKDLFFTALSIGAIEQRGAFFYIGDVQFRGKEEILSALRQDWDLVGKLINTIRWIKKETFVYYNQEAVRPRRPRKLDPEWTYEQAEVVESEESTQDDKRGKRKVRKKGRK